MALSMPSVACLLLLFILGLHQIDSRSVYHLHRSMTTNHNQRSLLEAPAPYSAIAIDCGGKCAVRCGKSWKPKMCNKMCVACCNKCSCVPPGTAAETRAMCPCYASMTTPRGKLKCP